MNTQEGRYKGAANAITGIRLVCSVALLFCLPFSPVFYALYLTAGITDMADGAVARATHTVSELGSRLDTVADFTFLAVCLVKLIPVLPVERWMMIWTAGIAVIKVINLISGYVLRKQLVAVHSLMNRATGVLLFALPLTLPWMDMRCGAAAVGAVATLAAIQEGHFIMFGGGGTIQFGIYACNPEDSSFKATFTHMELTECKWLAHDGQKADEDCI